MIFKDEDAGLADNCLAHAKDLYDFAINYKAKYSDSSPQGLFLKLIAFFFRKVRSGDSVQRPLTQKLSKSVTSIIPGLVIKMRRVFEMMSLSDSSLF